MNDIGGGASDHLLYNFYLLQKVIHWWNRKTPVRYVERNAKDVSKPVARHLNLPNHSRQHMAVCGLSLHLGKSESRKTLEKKLSSKSALLIVTVFLSSRHHIPTNNVAPFSAYNSTHNPRFLQSLWQRANARNVSFLGRLTNHAYRKVHAKLKLRAHDINSCKELLVAKEEQKGQKLHFLCISRGLQLLI